VSSNTFLYRYETGWQDDGGALENTGEYFAKKIDAMRFATGLVKPEHHIVSAYVYDRCLDLTRWYHQGRWSRTQPKF
jgi:hypothetical protein